MIEVIAEHRVNTTVLPSRAKILDLGCRGFLFTDYFRSKGHLVFAVDVDRLAGRFTDYIQCAVSNYDGFAQIIGNSDPQATNIRKNTRDGVPCYTLETFSKNHLIDYWDLIKIDVEGNEYDIIMDMKRPMAKQLSIEFHLHTGTQTVEQVDAMVIKLQSLGYVPVDHIMSSQHGAGRNYWDSLFIHK